MKTFVLFVALITMGCLGNPNMSDKAKAEMTYTTDILNCTNTSKTKLESKACECQADIRWHVAAPNACDEFTKMRGETK